MTSITSVAVAALALLCGCGDLAMADCEDAACETTSLATGGCEADAECAAAGDSAEAPVDSSSAADAAGAEAACRAAWQLLSNGRGDPFPMLAGGGWFIVDTLDGIDVELFPADWASFQLPWGSGGGRGSVVCDVPVAWFAVPRTVAPDFDPIVANVESGIVGSGTEATTRERAHDALGGLVLSWNRRFFKRVEASLQWFLQPGPSPDKLASRLRRRHRVPAEQRIIEAPLTWFVERSSAPVAAWRVRIVADESGDESSDAPWIVPRHEFERLRALPVEAPPASTDVESSLIEADIWPAFKSAVWSATDQAVSECRTGTNTVRNVIADEYLVEAMRRARFDGASLCVDLVWSPGTGWDLLHTEACVGPDGELEGEPRTRALEAWDLPGLSLPAIGGPSMWLFDGLLQHLACP